MKMKFLFALSLVLCINYTTGQELNKWSVGFGFSPDVCYRTLTFGGVAPDQRELFRKLNDNHRLKMGVTTGFQVKYNVNEKVSLESGVLYSNKGYSAYFENLNTGNQVGPQGFTGPPGTARIRYIYKYVDVPFKLNYHVLVREKLTWYLTGGFVANSYLQFKNVSLVNFPGEPRHVNTSFQHYEGLRPIDFSPFIGFGAMLNMGERTSLQLEPLFRHQVVPVYDAPVRMYLWNVGVNAVVYWRF